MLSRRIHPIAFALGAVFFAALLAIPAFCTTAAAHTPVTSGDEHPCSEHDASSADDSDCRHRCAASCEHHRPSDAATFAGAVISTYDEDDPLPESTTWWTPDLLATVWLVDRLAAFADLPPPVEISSSVHSRDRSDIHLRHSVMLR